VSYINLINNVFVRNAANLTGGAIFAYQYTSLSMLNNTFLLNSAVHDGGAISCSNCSIDMSVNNMFESNKAGEGGIKGNGGALSIYYGNLTTSGTLRVSLNSAKLFGGGIYMYVSAAALNGSTVVLRENSAFNGGALYIAGKNRNSKPLLVASYAQNLHFVRNIAHKSGGAIYSEFSKLLLGDVMINFTNNFGVGAGGAIFARNSSVEITGKSHFVGNCLMFEDGSQGGAIGISLASLILSGSSLFSGNKAHYGGSVYLLGSSATLKGTEHVFANNSAESGGAIHCEKSEIAFQTNGAWFSGNTANKGGAVAIIGNNISDIRMIVSGNFVHNTAHECGGGVFIQTTHIMFSSFSISNNTGSGLCIFYSRAQFTHNTLITGNTGSTGGGIHSENSELTFYDRVTFTDNKAKYFGGAIYAVYGRVSVSGISLLKQNIALRDGGAMFALGTDVVLNSSITFTSNSAQNGGAVCLRSSATVSISALLHLSTSHNYATEYGGVVYNEDSTMPSQCNFQAMKYIPKKERALLPRCFLRLTKFVNNLVIVYSHHDLAGKDGHFLYGGLLDRCRIPILNTEESVMSFQLKKFLIFQSDDDTTSRTIASKPYELCFCSSNAKRDCYDSQNIEVYRGQRFTVSLVAIDQTSSFVLTTVTAKTSSRSWVYNGQRTQKIFKNCTNVHYQLYSTNTYEELTLYPDGPCHDVGLATAVINVTFKPCPIGFKQSGGMCVCEDRLQKYHVSCIIDADKKGYNHTFG
jgi:predicted outer membrane repeat protein